MRGVTGAMAALAGSLVLATAQGSALYVIESNAKLYQASQTTGVATLVGTTSPIDTADLASDTRPGSYRLWTTNLARQLVSINPATGAGTVVGAFDPVNFLRMRTLAFDITNGKLYGTNGDSLSKLYEIDQQTGAASLLGTTGFDLGGLAADLSGNLFGIIETGSGETTSRIYKLDKLTGAPTLFATVPVSGTSDLAFRPEDGKLFGVGFFAQFDSQRSLYVIDLANETATKLGSLNATPGSLTLTANGLAFGPGTFVPEPGLTGFLVLGAMALLGKRRRN